MAALTDKDCANEESQARPGRQWIEGPLELAVAEDEARNPDMVSRNTLIKRGEANRDLGDEADKAVTARAQGVGREG